MCKIKTVFTLQGYPRLTQFLPVGGGAETELVCSTWIEEVLLVVPKPHCAFLGSCPFFSNMRSLLSAVTLLCCSGI